MSSYQYNASNELASNSGGSFTYDANGKTLTDPSGKSYAWDVDNRAGASGCTRQRGGWLQVPSLRKTNPEIRPAAPGSTNYLYDRPNSVEDVECATLERTNPTRLD